MRWFTVSRYRRTRDPSAGSPVQWYNNPYEANGGGLSALVAAGEGQIVTELDVDVFTRV